MVSSSEGADAGRVHVNHRRLQFLVPEQFLHGAHVVAVLDEMGHEGMAQAVAAGGLRDTGGAAGVADGAPNDRVVNTAAVAFPGLAVHVRARRGEQAVPSPFTGG
jgi:hypothetical protein